MVDLKELKSLAENCTVLYVEDEEKLRDSVASYLRRFFLNVEVAIDGLDGLDKYKHNSYDLVITDIKMPNLDGLAMAYKIKEKNQNQNILIVSAYSDIDNFTTSIKLGVDGYILKPIDFEQLNSTLYKTLYKIKQFKDNEDYKQNLEKLVAQKTLETKNLEKEKVNNYKKTLYALVQMIENRDTYTGGHSQRVANYSKLIAQDLGLSSEICDDIYQAGILHDIGKIAIPDTVLLKPGVFDDIEYKLIQEHVAIGVDMLNKVPMFKDLTPCIEAHHERIDGSGYPKGLKGDEILLESQIMAVSDTFDAMTTSRIYKNKKTIQEALYEIKNLIGKSFREDVVLSAIKVLDTITIDEDINQLPITQLEEARFSYFYKDQITQSYNASYFDLILSKNKYTKEFKYIDLIAVHNIDHINVKYGWEEGDKYLKHIAQNLSTLYPNSIVFRVYSDDFLIVSKDKISVDKEKLNEIICKHGMNFETEYYNLENQSIYTLHDFELAR